MSHYEDTLASESIEIASYLGDPSAADVVARIIRGFHEHGILAHGVKRAIYIGDVAIDGVLNNCPDNGKMESYWTTGRRVFLSEGVPPYHSMRTYDTTFFHYSAGGIALTTFELLDKQGINASQRGEHATVTLDRTVPIEAIELILPPGVRSRPDLDGSERGRDERQIIERALLVELARVAAEGVTPGTIHQSHF